MTSRPSHREEIHGIREEIASRFVAADRDRDEAYVLINGSAEVASSRWSSGILDIALAMSHRVQPSTTVNLSRRCSRPEFGKSPSGEMGEGKSYSPAFNWEAFDVNLRYRASGHLCLMMPSSASD